MTIDIVIIAVLLILGIILMLAEFFLLPGTTVAAVASLISFLAAIVYAFTKDGEVAGYITLALSVVLGVGTLVYLIKSNAMDRIALKTDVGSTVDQSDLLQIKLGDKGNTASRLNPIGQVNFDGIIVEAKSLSGEFIDEHRQVEILFIEGKTILVDLVEE